jgi:hypothetical protein
MNQIKIIQPQLKKNYKGNVIKLISRKDLINNFEEAYITKIKYKKIKGWKKHKSINLNLFVVSGKVKFIFYDENKNTFYKYILNNKIIRNIRVKPNIWFAFQGLEFGESLILNFIDRKFDPKESLSLPLKEFKYTWDNK